MTRVYDSEGNRPGTLYDAAGNRTCCDITGMPGYLPSETRADNLPTHYRNRGNGPTRIGFTGPVVYKPAFRGQMQEALERNELDEIALDGSELVIGVDKRLYEPRRGLIDCIAPVVAKGKPGQVYVNEVDWNSFPLLDQLAFLFDEFFSKYDREVLMIVGKKRDGSGWLFHVPRQEGSSGLVKWTATNREMDWFARQARWIGTIHVHPGSSCTPSTTDIDDWAAPEKTGLHLIFGRNQDYTINGAIAGRTFELDAGSLKDLTRKPVEWTTSGRRPLNELLLQPKPVEVVSYCNERSHFGNRVAGAGKNHPHPGWTMPMVRDAHNSEEDGFVAWMLDRWSGGLKIGQGQLGSMRIVFYRGSYYMMTLAQWTSLQEQARNTQTGLPSAKRLSIYPVKGGKV